MQHSFLMIQLTPSLAGSLHGSTLIDVGIETCLFYNGLDAYVKTWLQFVFPLYTVWLLNALEYSFLLNLIILSAGVLYSLSVDQYMS